MEVILEDAMESVEEAPYQNIQNNSAKFQNLDFGNFSTFQNQPKPFFSQLGQFRNSWNVFIWFYPPIIPLSLRWRWSPILEIMQEKLSIIYKL